MNHQFKSYSYLLLILPLFLILTAAGCQKEVTSLGRVAITTQINNDNTPTGESQQILLLTTPVIYLTAEIINAKHNTQVTVEWHYLTEDQMLATESFRGGRTQGRPHEFVVAPQPMTSFLSSRITLSDLSWSLGSYQASIKLNGQLVKQIEFNIVGDKEFHEFFPKAMLKSFYLGSQINNKNQITIPGDRFTRDQEEIYAVALLRDVPIGTTIKVTWKYLDANRVITDFSVPFSGDGYLPFKITLNRFSRLWSDGLWPVGIYEITFYVDNVLVTTKNFAVF